MSLIDRFPEFGDREAIVWRQQSTSYADLHRRIVGWEGQLAELGVEAGHCVAVHGDFSPATTALLLALVRRRCVAVPIAAAAGEQPETLLRTAEISCRFEFDLNGLVAIERRAAVAPPHPLLDRLRRAGSAGLVLFSSGSTGRSKAILLDVDRLLRKMDGKGRAHRTLAFLVFGHIGGINTAMRTLSNGGTLILIESRQPADVCRAIARHRVDLLPTTPTFLTMLLMSDGPRRHDLTSLRLITYGTEAMPPSTLRGLREALPNVELKQTYGLSELGILPTKSRSSDSLFMKIGGDGFETRVVDGVLWVRADTAMLGYLNAPSPISADGWFNTGDAVEVDGEYIRVLGRSCEIINVGGEKVYPAEVESVLLEVPNVRDAVVFGRESPVTGSVVCARVALAAPEEESELRRRIKRHCRARLEPFKVPAAIDVVAAVLHGSRYKKTRGAVAGGETPALATAPRTP